MMRLHWVGGDPETLGPRPSVTPVVLKMVLRDTEREVVVVHGARNSRVYAMKAAIRAVAEPAHEELHFLRCAVADDVQGYDYDFEAVVDLSRIADSIVRGAIHVRCTGRLPGNGSRPRAPQHRRGLLGAGGRLRRLVVPGTTRLPRSRPRVSARRQSRLASLRN
jgi:hypothetical protein